MQTLALTIRRGETVNLPIRIESDVLGYASITAIAKSAPVRITAAAHGLPDGWRAAVVNVKGMTELNAANQPPKDAELRRVTVVDPDTVEFNVVNAAGFKAYVSGGQLVFYKPLDMSLYSSARAQLKTKVGGEVLLTLSTADGTLEIDPLNSALWLRLPALTTAGLAFTKAVFDVELLDGAGNVFPLNAADSTVSILPEVTTS